MENSQHFPTVTLGLFSMTEHLWIWLGTSHRGYSPVWNTAMQGRQLWYLIMRVFISWFKCGSICMGWKLVLCIHSRQNACQIWKQRKN